MTKAKVRSAQVDALRWVVDLLAHYVVVLVGLVSCGVRERAQDSLLANPKVMASLVAARQRAAIRVAELCATWLTRFAFRFGTATFFE